MRIWALDPDTAAFRAQYAYPLDEPGLFLRDCAVGPVSKSDVKVSELASLPDGAYWSWSVERHATFNDVVLIGIDLLIVLSLEVQMRQFLSK